MAVGDLSTLHAHSLDAGLRAPRLQRHRQGQALSVLLARHAASASSRGSPRSGMTLYSGIEPEFMLLARDAERQARARSTRTDTLDKPCYDYKGLSRTSAVLDELITLRCAAVGIDVYQIDHEDANGQFEVNFTYADALKSADNFTFVKMAASEIARKHGMIAHLHAQAVLQPHRQRRAFPHLAGQRQAEEPVRGRKSDKRGLALSTLAYQFLGGVLAHARALAAVCAPTVNSYKRLVVGRALSGATWAPAYVAYGDNNRTACVRIPGGRLELRLPDSGCNPYLALGGGGRRGPRRHRAQARSGRAHQSSTCTS